MIPDASEKKNNFAHTNCLQSSVKWNELSLSAGRRECEKNGLKLNINIS